MARRLIRHEGLLCGGSSGAAVWASKQIARREGPGKRIVTILPDSVRNYMTKFLDDQWMKESGFAERGWEAQTVSDILLRLPRRELILAKSSETIGKSVMRMKEFGISQLPVVDEGRLVGIVTESDLLSRLVEGHATLASAVAEVMFRNVETVSAADDAQMLTQLFARGNVGIVVDDDQRPLGIITKMDLVDQLARKGEQQMAEATH
jgi:cystathionine beta-synthase